MNRFSKDLGAVDEILPDIFLDSLQVIHFFSYAILFKN